MLTETRAFQKGDGKPNTGGEAKEKGQPRGPPGNCSRGAHLPGRHRVAGGGVREGVCVWYLSTIPDHHPKPGESFPELCRSPRRGEP